MNLFSQNNMHFIAKRKVNRMCFSDNDSTEPWKVDGDTDERNEKARKAYQALLTVTARTPDNLEYLNFSREVKSLAQSKYNFTFGNSSVSTFVTAFYDAVLLYALALKESLPEKPGEVNLDGGNLTRRMWGKSFKGKKLQLFSLSLLIFMRQWQSFEQNFNLNLINRNRKSLIMYN